jgi:L-iditol 2-dehydrogenase
MIEPTAVAVHAVRRAGDVAARNVAVLGAGPIGNLVAQVAQSAGARVAITDLCDWRLDIARLCGLKNTSLATEESLTEAARRVFGSDGLDIVLECVGLEQTIVAAVESVVKGGKIVVVGVFAERVNLDVGLIQDRELSLIGSLMYKREDYLQAIELIAEGRVLTHPLESKHFSLRDYPAAYDFIRDRGDRIMKVFIDL